MKRLLVLSISAVLMLGALVAPAEAATVRVSTSVRAHVGSGATHVDFSASVSRASRVTITVYRGRKVVRVITAKRSGSRYTAVWNMKDSRGRRLGVGTYSYKVAAVSASGRAAKVGRVSVPAYTPPVKRWLGFYQSGAPANADALTSLESQITAHPAVVNFYVADSESFPASRVQAIAAHGSTPMITLEFWSTQTGGVDTITNGSKDAYLIAFADAAKAYGGEVWLRPFHEMNSNWYPWAGASANNSAPKVVAAWNHVREVFASRGAANVKFVWCVNNDSVPNTAANSIEAYWPGDAAVDMVAIDGYNFGTSATWSTWRPFSSVIGASYDKVTALTTKPLFLAETGCVEQGGDKAAWIADMFSAIATKYPRIAGVCWFNVNDPAENTDWRIDSSAASLAAFNAAIGVGY